MVKVNASRHLLWQRGREAKLSVYRQSSLKLWNQMNSWDTLTQSLSMYGFHQELINYVIEPVIYSNGMHVPLYRPVG